MSLVFTFLCATNQTKDFTLKGTWEFQTNFEGNFKRTEGDRCNSSSDRMRPSKSSISESERLWRKFKFKEKGREEPRTKEIGIFLSKTTLNSLGYWVPKGWSPYHKSSQNRILSPFPTTNRVNKENSWKTCAIAFQGQRCDHLTKVLASQPLECEP